MFNKLFGFILTRLPENNRFERIWKLAQVDFKKRYFNTKLGIIWAFINPVFRLFVYFFVFTWLGRFGGKEHYGLYIFSGLLVWLTFSEATNKGISLLQQKRYLLENIQFNKIDLFSSSTLSVFLGFLFNITAYLIISRLTGIPFFWQLTFLPLLIINLYILCQGVSMFLSAINIYFKDIKHIWSMTLLVGFWTAPIIFPLENFTGKLYFLIYLNPCAGIIINMRNAIMHGVIMDWTLFVYDFAYAILIFMVGRSLILNHWKNAIERA